MEVKRAPDGDVAEVTDGAAVGFTDAQVDRDAALLVVEHADGQSVRGGEQCVGHVAAADAGAQGVGLVVVDHVGFAARLPVVLHGVGVYVGAAAHDALGLCAEAAEHGGVGAGKLGLDGVRGGGGEVVLADADVGVGPAGAQLAADGGNLLHDGGIVLAVNHQFAVAVAAGGHGTHQTVEGRRAALAGRDALHGGVAAKQAAHVEQAGAHGVGVGGRGEVAFNDELLVVEVGEEEILYAGHAQDGGDQHGEGGDQRGGLVAYEQADRAAHGAVNG